MATKKSIPVKVERNEKGDYSGQHGMLYAYFVEMQNGDKGSYKCKDVSNPKFKVGVEIEYEVEVKEGVSSNGMEYKITSLKPVSQGGGGNWKRKETTPNEMNCLILEKVFSASAKINLHFAIASFNSDKEYMTTQRAIWSAVLVKDLIKDNKVVPYNRIKACFDAFNIVIDNLIASAIHSENIQEFNKFAEMYAQMSNLLTPKVNEETSNNN